MNTVTHEIVVSAPVETVYNLWTRFEEFPRFLDSVTKVTHLDDRHLLWNARFLGRDLTWEAEIDRQACDSVIEWHSTSGPKHRGVVTFEPWDAAQTRVVMELEYAPRGLAERFASAVGLLNLKVNRDLNCFKDFAEFEAQEYPAWFGNLPAPSRPAESRRIEVRERRLSPAPPRSETPSVGTRGSAIRI